MPYTIDRSKTTPPGGAAKPSGAKTPASKLPDGAKQKSDTSPKPLPLSQVPRPFLIGGGVTLLVIILGGLWFMMSTGPEDSGQAAANSAAAAASAAPVTATASSTNAARATASAGTSAPDAPGSANAPGSAPGPGSSPAAASPSPAMTAPRAGSSGAAMPISYPNPRNRPGAGTGGAQYGGGGANGGTPPAEVEGSPPVNSGAGDGSAWKPGDAEGKVYRHGPASDP